MPRKLIAANWKENPRTEARALKLWKMVSVGLGNDVDVVICPPFLFLPAIAHSFKKVKPRVSLGAQDVFWEEKGPFTSEVGPKMLRTLGVSHAIIGHSERRKWLKETDGMINKKVKVALKDGLTVILCVGESLAIRKKGMTAAKKFVAEQLRQGLKDINIVLARTRLFVAYEPVWAIGTGRSDSPADADEMASFIKSKLAGSNRRAAPNVLYGGSVNSKNIADYVKCNSIDGALVGGASLKAGEFKKIIKTVAKI